MTIFLIKLSVCWGGFALLYTFLLRHETFFRANRAYLLTALFGSILLADMSGEAAATQLIGQTAMPEITIFSSGLQQVEAATYQWENISYLWIIYWIGFSLSGLRMLWGLFCLMLIIRRGTLQSAADGIRLITSAEVNAPFSFFRWIIVPQTQSSDNTITMLAHERAHVKGRHSVDVLLLEICCVVFWFHPLVYWYRNALRSVHEYLADAAASRLSDKKQYGLLLIGQSQSGMSIAFANHFFQSPLKQRLVMLTKKTSSPLRAIKFGLTIPLLLLFVLVFRQNPATAQTNAATPPKSADPQFKGGMTALSNYLAQEIKYPENAKTAKIEGTVVLQFMVETDGSITEVKDLKPQSIHDELRAEAVRVVSAMPKWVPGVKEGKIIRAAFVLPIRFKLDPEPAKELTEVDKAPEFPGGHEAMMRFLGTNIQYPAEARKDGAEGLAVIQFVVEKDGSLSSFLNLKSARPDFADEAIRVLKLMPAFSPALKDGKAQRVKYTLPVRFKL